MKYGQPIVVVSEGEIVGRGTFVSARDGWATVHLTGKGLETCPVECVRHPMPTRPEFIG